MATYPGSPQITVDALLRRPQLIARALTTLTSKRFVSDFIFAHGTPEQVAGGAAWFQRSESIYPDRGAEEVGIRSEFPRTGWSEAIFSALVKKYGLEVPIAFESIRRNQLDQVARGERKLANALTKFVDTAAMTLITSDPAVLTASASANWTAGATTIISDIAGMRKLIADQDEGYELDTLVINGAQEFGMLVNTDIRNALPREYFGGLPGEQPFGGMPVAAGSLITGRPVPIMGLRAILTTPQLTAGTVLGLNAKVFGTIADEQPDPAEGYTTYDVNALGAGNTLRQGDAGIGPGAAGLGAGGFSPNAGFPNNYPADFQPVYVKVYNEDRSDDKIVRSARWPAMWLAEPKAVVKLTGA